MHKTIRRRRACLAACLLVLASLACIPFTHAAEPRQPMVHIPEYRYEGTYIKTYDTGAEGQYYEADGKTPLNAPVTDSLGGGELLVWNNVKSSDGFHAYAEDLRAFGYTCYAENDLNGNLFSTWVTDAHVVTLTYLPGMKQFSILLEPMRALPGRSEDNVYRNLEVENRVVLLTCGYVSKENGLCVIYQLCDGSFILVDSGFGFGYDTKAGFENVWQNQAKEIYSTLEFLAHESGVNDIVIAAWFFTHPHWDHIGGFIPFADLYADRVTLERVVFNWPNHNSMQEMITLAGQKMTHYIGKIEDAVGKFKGAVMIEAHAGQTYYIRDAVIDILLTWEQQTELSDQYESVNEGNSISLILDVKLGCERLIMMGDCGRSAKNALVKLYAGDFLKADFLQVAHHGYNAYTKAINDAVDPDVVLWPNENLNSEALRENFTNLPPELFYSNRQITVIPLPYTGKDGVVYRAAVYPQR